MFAPTEAPTPRHRRPSRRLRHTAGTRGFTLIEIVVVVVIIAVLAVIALPSITRRLKDRRASQVAQQTAIYYRTARMRAMGRGSAMLVRYKHDNGIDTFELREAIQGTAASSAACAALPAPRCTVSGIWNADAQSKRINILTAQQAKAALIKVKVKDAGGTPRAAMDVCYTPSGRAFVRYANTGAWASLVGVPSADVYREGGSGPIGLTRTVLILPNGTSRLAL